MRVLWIAAEPPDRFQGGGSIRQAHLVTAVARRAEVHLLVASPVPDDAVRAAVAGVTELELRRPAIAPEVGHTRQRLRSLWHAYAHRDIEEVVENAAARQALRRALATAGDYDLYHVEHLTVADVIPARRSAPWSLTVHQLPSRRLAQQAEFTPGGRRQWVLRREQVKAGEVEQRALRAYDQVFVCSDEDAAWLGGPPTVSVVANGVDTSAFAPTPLPRAPRLFFSGTLHWLPNVDGAVWFCNEVLPRVRSEVAETTLDIVGIAPHSRVLALGSLPGVTVHANVPRVQPYLDAARVALVPLRIGSGTRLKALEAMAAGRPVVGTSIGLEGISLEAGEHALVADDAAGMAAAVVSLLRDDARATRMAESARRMVELRYSWERIGAEFAERLLATTAR